MASLPTILLILAAVSVGATVIAILIAMRSAREARSAIFPIVREEETIRARRARIATFLLSAVTALFLGGWLATLPLPQFTPAADTQPGQSAAATSAAATVVVFATVTPTPASVVPLTQVDPAIIAVQPTQAAVINTPAPPATPTPGAVLEPTLAPATGADGRELSPAEPPAPTPVPPTATLPLPTLVPATATPSETPTPAPPTATPTSEVVAAAQVPTIAPRTPAPAGARMGPIQFAAEITSDVEAVDSRYLFPQGTKSVYAVFPYSGMVNGVNFGVVWYQNGIELWRDEQVWRWGREAQFYSYLNPPGEGLYKLELYVNDTVAATGIFEIR